MDSRYRILVTGCNGQLGREFSYLSSQGHLKHNFTFVTKNELDISNKFPVIEFFEKYPFDIIINCAAYTDVDGAENNNILASKINHQGVAEIAKVAALRNMIFIHFSTDYVFDGTASKPYDEDTKPSPTTIYGKTKFDGENAILRINPKGMIVRTSWLYSSYGKNFVKTIVNLGKNKTELKVVYDQTGSPTYARDLARKIISIIEAPVFLNQTKTTQVFHYCNLGEVTWYEFANEIFKLLGFDTDIIQPITIESFQQKANRPKYSVLSSEKISNTFDLDIPSWKSSLADCLSFMRNN